jgi:hypothetical protein
MNNIFQDLILSGDVMVYLDDILIAHSDLAHHHEIVQEVLHRLREHRLFLRPEKCEFEKSTIEYLGIIISHNHVEMDPVKVTGVAAWPTPENKKDVQQFLSFMNFYQRFIRAFSDVARPLFDLTKKGVAWTWTAALAAACQALKDVVTVGTGTHLWITVLFAHVWPAPTPKRDRFHLIPLQQRNISTSFG